MKKKIIYLFTALALTTSSCNDDFLEHKPQTDFTEATAFVSYENFRTYAWGLYSIFSDGNMRQYIGVGAQAYTHAYGDVNANYLCNASGTDVQKQCLAVGQYYRKHQQRQQLELCVHSPRKYYVAKYRRFKHDRR